MFRQLALMLTGAPPQPPPDAGLQAAQRVFDLHPMQLSRFLEEVWEARNPALRIVMPDGMEIPTAVPQLGLERDSGIRAQAPQGLVITATPNPPGTPIGGTFTLTFTVPGTTTTQTAGPLGVDAPAGTIQTALEALTAIGQGNVSVEGGPLSLRPVTVLFRGTLATTPIAQLTVGSTNVTGATTSVSALYPPNLWDHLIYAYMVENTRAYEIFRRVLEEFAYGERLGIPGVASQRWLRTTEQLFYRDSPPFQIYSLVSWIRPDLRALRRNEYHRMFGMDLNHGTDDNRPYPYPRAAAANTEFASTFEELLREVWRAIENVRNQVGANQTDVTTIANLARALFDMLRVRRQGPSGNLGRDELFHVSTMDWLHLTLSFDTPIVVDLRAQASSAAERLQKIGERVGLPAHSRSDSYFRLATRMSLILRELELGTFNDASGATALFQTSVFQDAMQETIAHWSVATGRDVKARPVSVSAPQPAPIRPAPRPIVGARPSTNGRAKVGPELIPS